MSDGETNTLAAHGLEEFISSCCAVVSSFWFLAGNQFCCYLIVYLEYNTVVALCYFLVLAGISFWYCIRT